MGNLEQIIRERKHDVDEAEGHHVYEDDVQVNIRTGAHIAAALEGVAGQLALGSRTAAARFLVESAVFDAMEVLGLTLDMGPEGDWHAVPAGQSHHEANEKTVAAIVASKADGE